MLSYQHSYHAGSLADLHKHGALAILLERLTARGAPAIEFAETHAGRGLYDLRSPEALKTKEAWPGFVSLFSRGRLPRRHPFMRAVAAVQAEHGIRAYPGSPAVARHFLRQDDEADLYELHPQEFAALEAEFGEGNIRCHRENGYDGVMALARRLDGPGLVLVDPSYEVKGEYAEVAEFVPKLHAAWREAAILVWYPVLEAGHHHDMIGALDRSGVPGVWKEERGFTEAQSPRLRGSGLYLVNTPPKIRKTLARSLLDRS